MKQIKDMLKEDSINAEESLNDLLEEVKDFEPNSDKFSLIEDAYIRRFPIKI